MDEAEYREKLNAIEDKLAAAYRERRALTEQYAEHHAPVLPPPRFQSSVQQRVSRCPRCGLSDISGAKK